MKPNIYDIVLERTLKRIEMASDRISANFKGVTPFDKELAPKDEMLEKYNTMTPDDINSMIETYGQEAVNDFILKMEELKGGR